VVLVPNIHLETPNYSITRVRSDDVIEEGTRSYQMVEMPTEEELAAAVKEPKPVRPEAAVKGITPATSAPIMPDPEKKTETPKVSLFARIKQILGLGKKPAVEEKATEQARRDANRNNRGGRNRNNRNNRGDKPEKSASGKAERMVNERPNSERPARQEARPQTPRPNKQQNPRPEKMERENAQAPTTPQAIPAELAVVENGVSEKREGRNRRNRNGRRDRGPRNENAQRDISDVENQSAEVAMESNAAKPNGETASFDFSNEAVSKAAQPVTTDAAPIEANVKPAKAQTVNAVETTQVSIESAPAQAETPAPEKAEKKPRAPRRSNTKVKTASLEESGLQLVETKADASIVQTVAVEEAPKKPRKAAAWQQKASETPKDEPLVIVQTQNNPQ
jgi:ribonuclease E